MHYAIYKAMKEVKTGQITFAVRDTSIDGVEIHKDDFMAMEEGKIVKATPSLQEAAQHIIDTMVDEDAEIVTVIHGEDVDEEQLEAVVSYIEENYEDVEVEVHDGKQPLYPFIFSVE